MPNNKEDDQNVDAVGVVQDVKLDAETDVEQGVKILEGGDDESDFSDDCQMDFDVIKDLWVRKQKKPPWVEVASVRSKNFCRFSICPILIKLFRDPLLLRAPFLNSLLCPEYLVIFCTLSYPGSWKTLSL